MKRMSQGRECCDFLKPKGFVKEEGQKFRVQYVVFKSNEKYIICDNEEVSWDEIMRSRDNFQSLYVPKFGKYEIEEFISYFMKVALFISKDITDLFNMDLVCDDFPYNITKISSDLIKERLLKCFEVVKKEESKTYLKFKWEEIS